MILLANLDYIARNGTYLRCPPGTITNGASTPRIMWSEIPPFGLYYLGTILHDAAYGNQLQIRQNDGTFTLANLAKGQCDQLLLEAMETLGVNQEERAAIFEGVNVFGQQYYDDARKTTA